MDSRTKRNACDAFNDLLAAGKLAPDTAYALIDDETRGRFVATLGVVPGYSRLKDYVFLWRTGPKGEWLNPQLVEVRDFIAAAREAKGALLTPRDSF